MTLITQNAMAVMLVALGHADVGLGNVRNST